MTCPAEKELLPSINKGPRISQQVDFQRTQLFVPPTEVETGLKKITNIRNNSLRLHVLNFPIHFHDSPTFSLRKRSQERDKSILSLVAPNFTPLCFDVVFHDCSSQFQTGQPHTPKEYLPCFSMMNTFFSFHGCFIWQLTEVMIQVKPSIP